MKKSIEDLTVIHSFPIWLPQTQTWMYNQIIPLQRLGVNIHVVCERTENLDQFFVDNIHNLGDESYYKQILDKTARKLKIRRYLKYLVEVGEKIGVNIIHSHFGNIGWANRMAAKKLGAKHVVTFYGYDVNALPTQYPLWKKRYIELFKEVDLVLCEGSHMADCIIELGCPKYKVKIQHLGINLDALPFKPRRWQPGEPLKVLISSSFREKKGIPYALEALKIVNETIPIQLTIIGDANQEAIHQKEKSRILSILNNSELKYCTRLLGYQPHRVMLEEAYCHHIFLHPSVTASNGDTEGGAPVSIIEMMASGMPVVATRHCDIPEVFGKRLSNLLVSERDIEQLVDRVFYLANNTNDWLDILREGRKRVEKEYSIKIQTSRLVRKYLDIV